MQPEKWYSVREFAATLNLSINTIHRMLKDKSLRAFKVSDKKWLISSVQENMVASNFEAGALDDIPILRMAEVQEILGVSPQRVRDLCKKGQMSCTIIRKARRFTINDLRSYLVKRGKFRASAAKKQRARELALFARKRLGLDGPDPEIGYDADSMEELRAIIETIANLSSDVRRAQCFEHLFRHFRETGRYIGMKPIPQAEESPAAEAQEAEPPLPVAPAEEALLAEAPLATESSSSHSPMEESESPFSATGSSSAASPEPNQ